MKIIVTGSRGFIGSSVLSVFNAFDGIELVNTDRSESNGHLCILNRDYLRDIFSVPKRRLKQHNEQIYQSRQLWCYSS